MEETKVPQPSKSAKAGRLWPLLLGAYLLVLSFHLVLVEHLTSPLPFWDEWGFESRAMAAAGQGRLDWLEILSGSNVHRSAWVKLLSISTVGLNDNIWDAQVVATINTLLSAAVPTMFLWICLRGWPGGGAPILQGRPTRYLLAAVAALWLSPVLWSNVTWSMQGAFHQFMLLSGLGIALMLGYAANRWAWWLGALCLGAASLTMGASMLAPLAVIGTLGLVGLKDRAFLARQGWALGIAAFLALICYLALTEPTQPSHFWDRPLSHHLLTLLQNFSWPWSFYDPSLALTQQVYASSPNIYPFALLLWLPAPIWLILQWRRKALGQPAERVLAGLILWSYALIFTLALMRSDDGRPPAPRHYDFHVAGVLLNFVAALLLTRHGALERMGERFAWARTALPMAYLVIFSTGLLAQSLVCARDMIARLQHIPAQQKTVREFLKTNDFAILNSQPLFHTPYWDPMHLAIMLRDPKIYAILPPEAKPPLKLEPAQELPRPIFKLVGTQDSDPETMVQVEKNSEKPMAVSWALPEIGTSYVRIRYTGMVAPTYGPRFDISADTSRGKSESAQARQMIPGAWNSITLPSPSKTPGLTLMDRSSDFWITAFEVLPEGRLTWWLRRARKLAVPIFAVGACLLCLWWARGKSENAAA